MLLRPLSHVLFRRPPTYSYVGTVELGTNVTTYTFSATALGPAYPDRTLVVIAKVNSVAGAIITSCTITTSLFAMTKHVDVTDTTNTNSTIAIFSIPWPTGTSDQIQVIVPDAGGHAAIDVYSLRGLTTHRPHGTVSAVGSDSTERTMTLSSRNNAIIIAGVHNYHGSNTENVTYTWAGDVTEDNDLSFAAESGAHSCASGYSKGSNAQIIHTPSATASRCSVAASFY